MNKFKKAIAAILTTVTVASSVLGITSCFGPDGNDSNVNVVAYDGSAVTIRFYHTMGANLRGVLDKYIPKFNALYPNITIEHESQGDYPGLRNNIALELGTANEYPHIAYCYPDHVALYNKTRKVVQMDAFIESDLEVLDAEGNVITKMGLSDEQVADFIPGYYNEGKAYGDDKMYTLPWSKSTEVLYYNKTFFEENDLMRYVTDAEGNPIAMTWDQMEELCVFIKQKCPNDIPFGYDSEANWFITMTEQMGTPYTSATGEKYLFNTQENRDLVKRLRDWYQKGYFTTEEIYQTYTSDLFTETDPAEQKSYMCIGSSAGASYQNPKNDDGTFGFEVGVTYIPQMNPEQPKAIQQGPSVCMFKKPDMEMAAAWLFVKFFTTTVEFQADFSIMSGYSPVIQSAFEDPIYKEEFLDEANGNEYLQATCVKQTLTQSDSYYVSPAFVGSSAARDQVGMLMQACFTNSPAGNQSMDDFIKAEFDKTIYALKYESSN